MMENVIGSDALTALMIFGGAAALFISNRIRSDIIGVLVVTAMMISGVLTTQEALSGFSNPVLIILIIMFVVSEALTNTGVAQRIGALVMRIGGESEVKLIALLMLAAGAVGSFMNSTATMGIFIPIAIAVSQKANLNKKRILMPLGIAALTSGMMTLVASNQNLIASQTLIQAGYENLDFFSFTPIGITVLAVAILYMLFFGRGLLGKRFEVCETGPRRTMFDLIASYGLQDQVGRYQVMSDSQLIGCTLPEARFRRGHGMLLVGIDKKLAKGRLVSKITPETIFGEGDILIIAGKPEKREQFSESHHLKSLPRLSSRKRKEFLQEIGLAEILIAPDSRYVGQTLEEIGFRNLYKVTVLGVRQRGSVSTGDIAKTKLNYGDALLVCGGWDDIQQLKRERVHFVVLTLPEESCEVFPARRSAPWALSILAAMVTFMALDVLPTVTIALMAALALVLTRCVDIITIYRKISWPTVVLVAGMLPVATALTKTGASDFIAGQWVDLLGQLSPLNMLGVLFFLTASIGWFLPSTATAVLVLPIAIEVAVELGVSPHAFAMTAAIAIACAFVSPISSPTNLLTMEAGGYEPIDFIKVGFPLLCIASVVTVVLMGLIYL